MGDVIELKRTPPLAPEQPPSQERISDDGVPWLRVLVALLCIIPAAGGILWMLDFWSLALQVIAIMWIGVLALSDNDPGVLVIALLGIACVIRFRRRPAMQHTPSALGPRLVYDACRKRSSGSRAQQRMPWDEPPSAA